jgi:hypothetical protein
MTVLVAAYILSFVISSKCTLSTYHYYVALDTILLGCSCLVTTFVATRKRYWANKITAAIRFILTIVIFILLWIFIGYQMNKNWDAPFPHWNPQSENSTLLLPVSCFFDPDLVERHSPFDSSTATTPAGEEAVKTKALPHIWLYIILTILATLAFAENIFFSCGTKMNTAAAKWVSRGIRGSTLIFGFGTTVFCAWHFNELRKWADGSGWLSDKSENEVSSVGQLLPLVAFIAFPISAFDSFRSGKKVQKRKTTQTVGKRGYSLMRGP